MALIISHQFFSKIVAITPLHHNVQRPSLSLILWCEFMSMLVLLIDFFVVVSLNLDLQATSQLEVVLQLA